MSTAAPFARFVNDYPGLVDTFRERTEQMQIARLELDRLVGLPDGYSGKLLSKNPRKNIGIASLGPLLSSLGLVLCVLEDPAARDRTLARRAPFDAANRRVGNHCNPKKSASDCALPPQTPVQIEKPKPRRPEPAMHSHLHVVEQRHKGARFGGTI